MSVSSNLKAVTRFIPSPTTLAATFLFSVVTKRGRHLTTPLHRFLALVLWLNWRALPGIWHVQLWALVPLVHLKYRTLGVYKTFSIAKDPFDTNIRWEGFVGLDLSDWNMHLSNTSYGRVLDRARFRWLLRVVGPPMGLEKMYSPLAQTTYLFLREVPIFSAFEIDVHVASWDDKWIYYVARFTTPGPKPSSPRILNCVALSRSCFKLKGSRLSIPPARILSIAGVGLDLTNWERTLKLRKERKSREWLIWGGLEIAKKKKLEGGANGESTGDTGEKEEDKTDWHEDGMSCYEERRLSRLKVIHDAVNGSGWETL